jgi:hypothetical protein
MLKETPKNKGVRMAGKDIGGTKWEPPIEAVKRGATKARMELSSLVIKEYR